MITRRLGAVLVAALLTPSHGLAQGPAQPPMASQFVDSVNGLALEEAINRALSQEPSLRAARSQIDVARGLERQAGLRPDPTASFERREEPAGTDNQTSVGLEWPLDLFRRGARVAVAARELTATELGVADRERLLRADVRARFGEVLIAVRELSILEELVGATRRQRDLLRSRVEQGASPPLERNLLEVELRRLEAEHLLQGGRTEAALIELKQVLGMNADAPLAVRDTLEGLGRRELASPYIPVASSVIDQRTDVREASARVDIAEAKVGRVQAEGRFDISLFANYMRMDAGFPQQAFGPAGGLERVRGQFQYVSGGAMVRIPLLNRNQGEIAAARAERAGAAATYEAARLTAGAERAAALVRDARARQAVDAYAAGAQTLARENLSVVSQSYELGRVTVFDVLAEQRRYLEAERAYTETLRAAYEARTALERALGGVR